MKGSPVRSLQKFVESNLSAEQREVMFSRLPPEFAARLRGPILPTETISVHILNRFTEEAAKARGEPLESFAMRAGREGANEAVRGIYRFFVLVLTPPALLSKGGHMWRSLYNRGELRVENQTSNSARIRLVDFPAERAGCLRVTGWIEKMAELTGVTVIRVEQTKCFAQGAPACEWELEWG
ncbi:MAG TPA: hypothetical protein VMS98_04565 [Thermoanaerobaculia bacterium]|nr:hypothetical protein [Thermoanaerobaculia bacterium]